MKYLTEFLISLEGRLRQGVNIKRRRWISLCSTPNMTEFAGRSAESNPQPCSKALHLQCSAVQLQLGGGGKSLFSLTLAQSFAAFEKNQPLCLPLMSPSFWPVWQLGFNGSFQNYWAVFRNIFINGRPCFMQVCYPLQFFSSSYEFALLQAFLRE